MPKAIGELHVHSWNETEYEDRGRAGKLTRATVAMAFIGDVNGCGGAEWLMCHRANGTARFTGLLRIEATINGRLGGFVVESNGDFDGETAIGVWTVIPGSGMEELAGMSGTGRFEAPMGSTASFVLEYSFRGFRTRCR